VVVFGLSAKAASTTKSATASVADQRPPSAGTAGATHAVRDAFGTVPLWQATHASAPDCPATVPAGQGLHAGEPGAGAKVPGGQSVQLAAAGGDVEPAGQAMLQMNAPDCGWKKPAAHWVQLTVPSWSVNVPGKQGMHCAEPGIAANVDPLHTLQLAEPAGEAEPAKQTTQDVEPIWGAAVPGAHGWQGCMPVGLNCPNGHCCARAVPAPSHATQATTTTTDHRPLDSMIRRKGSKPRATEKAAKSRPRPWRGPISRARHPTIGERGADTRPRSRGHQLQR
jgi:hypothetical protein